MKTTIKTCTKCKSVYDTATTHICTTVAPLAEVETVPQPHLGMVIDRKYRLEGRLGEGGMGSVFRARRLFIDDYVAVKFLRPEVLANADMRQRFYQEAQVAARMKHPHVVAVYDFGETSSGLVYLVMEHLEGQSLGELLSRKGPLPLGRVLDLGIQICAALNCMLENNVIHRDLKPDNIMLVPDGQGGERVKVVDFGVAKILESDAQLTRVQSRIGSPVYSSPEQYLGKAVDHRSDLYGLGVILHECLSGEVPFEGLSENELLAALLHRMPPRLDEKITGLTSLMADLVHWLLAKDPNDRPASAAEVAQCLQALREGKSALGIVPRRAGAQDGFSAAALRRAGAAAPAQHTQPPARPQSFTPQPADPVTLVPGPVFRPRSTRRKLKRRLKRFRRPAALVFGAGLCTALVWELTAGAESTLGLWPWLQQRFAGRSATERAQQPIPPAEFPRSPAGALSPEQVAPAVGSPPTGPTTSAATPPRVTTAPIARAEPAMAATNNGTPANRSPRQVESRRLPSGGNGVLANNVSPSRSAATAEVARTTREKDPGIAAPGGMVWIKEMVYQRGNVAGRSSPNEQPAHWVRVGNIYLGKYEVTNGEYLEFVKVTGGNLPEWMDSSSKYHYQLGTDPFYRRLGSALYSLDHPVVGVSWHDADKYCAWLSQQGAYRYRLPTEAEWELAARGGDNAMQYSWGNGAPQLTQGGNVADEALKRVFPEWPVIWRAYNDAHAFTAPVGKFGSNALGLYDLTGNVWEWCSDWYDAGYYRKREHDHPAGPRQGSEKVIRGGSWSDTPDKLRLTYRQGVPPSFRSNNLGFRVVAEKR